MKKTEIAEGPISQKFGFDRGTPVDRYYIEVFLAAYSRDIRGRALEVGDASYCRKFGTGIVARTCFMLRRTVQGRPLSATCPFLTYYQRELSTVWSSHRLCT